MDMTASIRNEIMHLLEEVNDHLNEIAVREPSPINLPEALYYSAQHEALIRLYAVYSIIPTKFAEQWKLYHKVNQRIISDLQHIIKEGQSTSVDQPPPTSAYGD